MMTDLEYACKIADIGLTTILRIHNGLVKNDIQQIDTKVLIPLLQEAIHRVAELKIKRGYYYVDSELAHPV